ARTPRRPDRRCRRPPRLGADAIDARAAYPAREGDQQHLHELRAVRARLHHPHGAVGRGRLHAARRAQPRACRDAGRATRGGARRQAHQRHVLQRADAAPAAAGGAGGGRAGAARRLGRRPGEPLLAQAQGHGRAADRRRNRDQYRRGHGGVRAESRRGAAMSEWSQALGAFGREAAVAGTIGGNRGLQVEEPLLFERDQPGRSGVDLPEPPPVADRLGGLRRRGPIGLPGLSEPQVVRHFTRLSQKNYAIDTGLYPLGSCTMKHNPRLNEKLARLPGFADLHPLQPVSTVQGALELMAALAHWLEAITGLPAVALSPAAGAHGELCGMLCIRAALDARGEARRRVLVPESAHGTNPATAAACGFTVDAIPANERGRVDLAALKTKLGPDVAAIMLTNPNTCGLFEDEITAIADAVHAAGAYFYCDGANFN